METFLTEAERPRRHPPLPWKWIGQNIQKDRAKHPSKRTGIILDVSVFDRNGDKYSERLSDGIPKPETLISAFIETVLEWMVRRITSVDVTKAFSGATAGIQAANKVFMTRLTLDARIRVTVLERRCEPVMRRCWWGGCEDTGQTKWVEKTKDVVVDVPLVAMDLTMLTVGGIKPYQTGILITETHAWQQVASHVDAKLKQLRANPAALRGVMSDALRAKFPGSTINLPAK